MDAIGFFLHIPYHNEVIGGPKTAAGTALSCALIAYYLCAMTDKRHGAKAYGSTHPQRDFLASSVLATLDAQQQMLAGQVMSSLEHNLALAKKEDLSSCNGTWLRAKLWAYHSPLHDALRAIQVQMRQGDFTGAKAAINAIDDNLTGSYDAELETEITRMKSAAAQLAEARLDAQYTTACCC